MREILFWFSTAVVFGVIGFLFFKNFPFITRKQERIIVGCIIVAYSIGDVNGVFWRVM